GADGARKPPEIRRRTAPGVFAHRHRACPRPAGEAAAVAEGCAGERAAPRLDELCAARAELSRQPRDRGLSGYRADRIPRLVAVLLDLGARRKIPRDPR